MQIQLNELMYQVSFALDCVEKDLLNATTNHSKRVAYICILLGKEMGMTEVQQLDLACAAILHDNALTEYILSEKKYNQDREVRKINMAKHCVLGEKNAKAFPFRGKTEGYILYHHENADGSGAFGKKWEEIPLGAQLIRIADHVDVSFHLGQYNQEKLRLIREHIEKNRGIVYGQEVGNIFTRCITDHVLKQLSDEAIDQNLRRITPESDISCSISDLIPFSEVISRIIDYKSPFTKEHSYQIAQKAMKMATYYQADSETRLNFYLAAALHDLGKLATPLSILEKPGPLTDEEFVVMKKHALYTLEMLEHVSGLEQVTYWAAAHHEKLDGTGYPCGKKADELDFYCRLLACIDIYQALSEDRPYRKGMDHETAMKILRQMGEDGVIDQTILKDIDVVFGEKI